MKKICKRNKYEKYVKFSKFVLIKLVSINMFVFHLKGTDIVKTSWAEYYISD